MSKIKFKQRKHCLFQIISFAVIISSCNMSDSEEKLPGKYRLVHNGKDYNVIYGENEIYPNVENCIFNDEYILVCQVPNKTLYKTLLASNLWSDYYSYNSYIKDSLSEKYSKSRNEILADSTIFKIFKNKKISFENSKEDIKKSNSIADSIIKNNSMHKKIFLLEKVYWVIELKNDVLFGPLTLKEFEVLKKEKKIDLDFED